MPDDNALLFPLWQPDRSEYHAICAHLGLTPNAQLYERLTTYLASAPFRFPRPGGFSLSLAMLRLTRFRVARLDVATKLLFRSHPVRHVLNGVIALHECDPEGEAEMAAGPTGAAALLAISAWLFGYFWRLALTVPWLGWRLLAYAAATPFDAPSGAPAGRVLVTGVNRGLGKDLMLYCLERGAQVVGTVRNADAADEVRRWLPAAAPVMLLVVDLSQPGALVGALEAAQISPESVAIAILSAGTKHEGAPVVSLAHLRETFEVNFFSAAEFARWFCATSQAPMQSVPKRALVLVSSIGRWHGMHFVGGYNASKAALSIWGESLDMELDRSPERSVSVTIVEPGIFESSMSDNLRVSRILFASRRRVAARIVAAARAGKPVIRPPFWFALLTWTACLAGRDFRYRLFRRGKPPANGR
jgi:short-subunit dehydrogenase